MCCDRDSNDQIWTAILEPNHKKRFQHKERKGRAHSVLRRAEREIVREKLLNGRKFSKIIPAVRLHYISRVLAA
jgi:hypothetical protein